MIRGKTTVVTRLPQLVRSQHAAIAVAVGATVFDAEGEIKANIVAVDAIDSGNMLNTTQGHHDAGDLQGDVTTAAPYWIYPNYGTSRQAAKPFLEPALDAVAPRFHQRIVEALDG